MKTTILKTAILLFITFISCSTNNNEFTPTLPEATQTGQNTFGCYVDGNLLIPRNGTGYYGTPDKGMDFWGATGNAYNEIRARDFKGEDGGIIDIHIDNLNQIGLGTYTINQSNCERLNSAYQNINIRSRWRDKASQEFKWYCSIENGGTITITRYDYDNKIVSGTFSCTVQNKDNPNETIEITEGRFDIKWDTLRYTNFL